MNPETWVTTLWGYFNWVVYAVCVDSSQFPYFSIVATTVFFFFKFSKLINSGAEAAAKKWRGLIKKEKSWLYYAACTFRIFERVD